MKFTTEDLYEQAKRVLRRMAEDAGISNTGGLPFLLACHACGLPFPMELEVGMAAQHAAIAHGWKEGDKLTLDLVWIGEGPPPEAHP